MSKNQQNELANVSLDGLNTKSDNKAIKPTKEQS